MMGNCSCPAFGSSSNRQNNKQRLLTNAASDDDNETGLFGKANLVIIHDPNSKEKPFSRWIELSFYAFAGSSKYSKKQGLYMNKTELSSFLDSVGIHQPSMNEIFMAMDSDIVDNRISVNEFVDYFCSVQFNPNCVFMQECIESNDNWQYLQKALRIFDIIDINHKGYLIFDEFITFGHLIGLSQNEATKMWTDLDHDDTGSITIDEMFKWYKKKYLKSNTIQSENQKMMKQEETKKYNTFVNTNNMNDINDDNGHYSQLTNDVSNENNNENNFANGKIDYGGYSHGKKLGDYMREHLQKDNSHNSIENESLTRDYEIDDDENDFD